MMLSLSLAAALAAAGPAGRAAARPNIVLIMADDQGYGETGYRGHPHVRTPVLDRMAAGGLRLDNFRAASPVCSPTRASVMTGRHANRSGAFAPNWSTRPEEITLARILRDDGYATGHFGKWHLGAVKAGSPVNPAAMGFEEYLSHDNFFEMDPPLSRNGAAPVVHKGEGSEVVAAAAADFVRRAAAAGRPFLVVLWFGSPHSPYSGLPEDLALYAGVESDDLRARHAEITAMDRAIGRFRDAVREAGAGNDTLVWYCSDNGTPVPAKTDPHNGGFRGTKGDLYEGGLRVPAIVEWPAVIRGPRTSDLPCTTSDILPTVLDVAGARHPAPDRPLDGISLRQLLVDGTMSERPGGIGFWKHPTGGERRNERWIPADLARGTTPTVRNPAIDFLNFRHPAPKTADFGGEAAWLEWPLKLLVFGRRVEMYDLAADPGETRDIAGERADAARRMRAALEDWQRSVERSLSGADYR